MTSRISCGEARRTLWPEAGPRAASDAVVAAQQHLAGCDACQRFMADMSGMRRALHENAPRPVAPPEVRDRVFAQIARARAGGERRSLWSVRRWVGTAAAALVLLLGGALVLDRVMDRGSDPLRGLAQEHATAVGETRIVSGDAAVVQRWIATHARFAMLVPTLPDARLTGARLRLQGEFRGVVVEYDVKGVPVSYFVIPQDPARWTSGEHPPRLERLTRSGYRVVAWREPGMLHAMIASLPAPQLDGLAQACIKQARGAVASRVFSHSLREVA